MHRRVEHYVQHGGSQKGKKDLNRAHLYLLKLEKSKPATVEVRASMPQQYSVAAAGMTVAPACSTFFLAMSSRYSQLLPSRPAWHSNTGHVDKSSGRLEHHGPASPLRHITRQSS